MADASTALRAPSPSPIDVCKPPTDQNIERRRKPPRRQLLSHRLLIRGTLRSLGTPHHLKQRLEKSDSGPLTTSSLLRLAGRSASRSLQKRRAHSRTLSHKPPNIMGLDFQDPHQVSSKPFWLLTPRQYLHKRLVNTATPTGFSHLTHGDASSAKQSCTSSLKMGQRLKRSVKSLGAASDRASTAK